MTDEAPKVVSMFTKKAIQPEQTLSPEQKDALTGPNGKRLDVQATQTVNSIAKAVLEAGVRDVIAIATDTETGMPRLWLSFREGSHPQLEAMRYLGQLKLLESYLINVATNNGESIE